MHHVISGLYLTIHIVGLVLVFRYYRGTRAFFPGVATFLMLACAYASAFAAPRDIGVTDRWPGAAWLGISLCTELIGSVGDFCLLGLIFALAAPQRGSQPKGEIWLALAIAAVGYLGFDVMVVFFDLEALLPLPPLAAICYCLVAVAIFRRFRTAALGVVSAMAFLVEGIAVASIFLVGMLSQEPSDLFILALRTVGLLVWLVFLVFLATVPTNSRFRVSGTFDTPRSSFGEYAGICWAMPFVLVLFLVLFWWSVYEVRTGGPVASLFTWAKDTTATAVAVALMDGNGWLVVVCL